MKATKYMLTPNICQKIVRPGEEYLNHSCVRLQLIRLVKLHSISSSAFAGPLVVVSMLDCRRASGCCVATG